FTTLHGHALNNVRLTEFAVAPYPCVRLVGERLGVQTVGLCRTVKFCPAMTTTPVRPSEPGFAATLQVTLALFTPFVGETKIQLFVFTTSHAQPPAAVNAAAFVSGSAFVAADAG